MKSRYIKLKERLDEYNWDDGFEFPAEIIADECCDLALALEVFYLADGYGYIMDYSEVPRGDDEWKKFAGCLMKDILDKKYQQSDNHFEIPLTKVQIYKLRKQNVPEILITDI